VLTIIASAGLYLLLSAEFMAFALIIVYAGAILITYLFVIMLATESPTADEVDQLAEYDRYSREPLAATFAGFVLLAALTTILAGGASTLRADPSLATPGDRLLASSRDSAERTGMRKKVETALRTTHVPKSNRLGPGAEGVEPLLLDGEGLVFDKAKGGWAIVVNDRGASYLTVADQNGEGPNKRTIPAALWPTDLRLSNVERVAFELIDNHPGSIEIAGVILLMAMLGAVVLARKKVDLDEAEKHAAVNVLGGRPKEGAA
jgi:NADH-quinone oxidoreductase subunit J